MLYPIAMSFYVVLIQRFSRCSNCWLDKALLAPLYRVGNRYGAYLAGMNFRQEKIT